MLQEAVTPPELIRSYMVHEGAKRMATLPDMVSVSVRELFPDMPEAIYSSDGDITVIREATEQALSDVDMTMIRPGDSVNILMTEQGLDVLGGQAYAEMIRTIKDVVEQRTGCTDVRLRFGECGGVNEGEEMWPQFQLDEYFQGRIAACGPFDKGIPIETDIGKLYGLARIYDADWLILAYYDFPRELYLHRQIDKACKSFAMCFARAETRSAFHNNFGNRSANVLGRAIYRSSFVQKKFAFSCFQLTSPDGVIKIDADNDLISLNARLTASVLRSYGKLLLLLGKIDECIVGIDGDRIQYYIPTGGLTFGNLLYAHQDFLDLDIIVNGSLNPSVKAIVVNSALVCYFLNLVKRIPTFFVGKELGEAMAANYSTHLDYLTTVQTLEGAMWVAMKTAGTDKVILFDGCYGNINMSASLGDFLIKKAPEVSRMVDEHLMDKWLKQRAIDPRKV